MLNKIVKLFFTSERIFHRKFFAVSLLTVLLSACSVTPETAQPVITTLNKETQQYYIDAIKQMKSGNTKKAQLLLSKVIRLQPGYSNAHLNLGIVYLKIKMNKKAEVSFQQALKLDPDNKYALNQQAFLFRLNGDFSKAKANYEKAIDIDSEYANAHLNLGILYDLYLYDLEKALQQYKKYNKLSKGKNKMVSKWIVDLERRYKKTLSQK